MFKAVYKIDSKEYEIYHVQMNNTGYPHFLIYRNGQWKYISAKHFVPTYEFLTIK